MLAAVKKAQSFCSETEAAQEGPLWTRIVTVGHGGGVENPMDIPLTSDPFPEHAEKLNFSSLSNVINQHFGKRKYRNILLKYTCNPIQKSILAIWSHVS